MARVVGVGIGRQGAGRPVFGQRRHCCVPATVVRFGEGFVKRHRFFDFYILGLNDGRHDSWKTHD